MKDSFVDDQTMNRMLNALIMMFLANGVWGWLMNIGDSLNWSFNPINLMIAAGTILIVFDLKNYEESPKPKPLLIGTALLPVWWVFRFIAVKK